MSIRILLILFILVLLMRFLSSRTTPHIRAGKKLLVLLFFGLAIFSIVFPDVTTQVANQLGVGRGADLLLYCLTLTLVGFVIDQYLHRKEIESKLVKITRRIALQEAATTAHNQQLDKKRRLNHPTSAPKKTHSAAKTGGSVRKPSV